MDHHISWESEKSEQTPSEAKTWAQKHMNMFQYNMLFGDVSTDDDRIPAGLMIRKDHKERLKQRAQQEGKSFDELLDEALTAFLQWYIWFPAGVPAGIFMYNFCHPAIITIIKDKENISEKR